MKLPAFNHAEMEWDSWRAFHNDHGYRKFTQFDTGELVVCSCRWQPDARHVYKELHLQVVATDDKDCPRLYLPGLDKPIPKSHLYHKGQQTLLLDLDHKRAVGLSDYLTKENAPLVPERFTDSNSRSVTAWYAGPDAVPVGSPITRHYPQPLEPDERKHINELADACKVWLQMQPDPEALKKEHRKVKTPVNDFIGVSFAILTLAHRTAIAERGFNMIVKGEHPWLTFNGEGVTEDDNKDD